MDVDETDDAPIVPVGETRRVPGPGGPDICVSRRSVFRRLPSWLSCMVLLSLIRSCPLLLPGFEGVLGSTTDAFDEDISISPDSITTDFIIGAVSSDTLRDGIPRIQGLIVNGKSSKGLKCRVYLHHGGLPHFIPVLRLSFSPHHSIYPRLLMSHDLVHQ